MSNTIYQSITDKIIKELETGAAPWVKPWSADNTADRNIVTGNAYRGINRLILGLSGMQYGSSLWASYDQWQSIGGQVRKGEKATQGVFFKPQVVKKGANGSEDSVYMLLKPFWVFNANQVDGITITKPDAPVKPFNAIEAVDNAIKATGANITHGGDMACYSPTLDMIKMPHRASFDNESSYYATLLHEMTHWSGHAKRCDRKMTGRYGSPDYAFEELVAEIGAAYLCGDFKIAGELRHAGYIESWLKCLRADNKAIFRASALAQKAVELIHSATASNELIAA